MPDVFVSEEDTKETEVSKEKETKMAPAKKGKMSHNPLAAYVYKPYGVTFETKREEEHVILLLRRHPITNLPWVLLVIGMAIAPVILLAFPIISFLPGSFQLVSVIGWYLLTTAVFLENFLIWYFNVSIVTDRRLVDIDFYNLLYKEVSEAEIFRIQDVTYKMGGAIRTIFNYGDILVQTAAENPNFDFLAIPRPDRVVKVLEQLREKHKRG